MVSVKAPPCPCGVPARSCPTRCCSRLEKSSRLCPLACLTHSPTPTPTPTSPLPSPHTRTPQEDNARIFVTDKFVPKLESKQVRRRGRMVRAADCASALACMRLCGSCVYWGRAGTCARRRGSCCPCITLHGAAAPLWAMPPCAYPATTVLRLRTTVRWPRPLERNFPNGCPGACPSPLNLTLPCSLGNPTAKHPAKRPLLPNPPLSPSSPPPPPPR